MVHNKIHIDNRYGEFPFHVDFKSEVCNFCATIEFQILIVFWTGLD